MGGFCKIAPVPRSTSRSGNPYAVAAYARSLERKYKPTTIRKHVAELTPIHTKKTRKRLAHSKIVQRTLDMIERRARTEKQSSKLCREDDISLNSQSNTSQSPKNIKKNKILLHGSVKCEGQTLSGRPRLVARRSLSNKSTLLH